MSPSMAPESEVRPYTIELPDGISMTIYLQAGHKSRFDIVFDDENKVEFAFSGEKGTKGTVRKVGTFEDTTGGEGPERRLIPSSAAAGARRLRGADPKPSSPFVAYREPDNH